MRLTEQLKGEEFGRVGFFSARKQFFFKMTFIVSPSPWTLLTVMRSFLCALSALLVTCKNGSASGELTATGQHSVHINHGNFSNRHLTEQESFQIDPSSGSGFDLKVQVNDAFSGRCVRRALVEVYVNYSQTNQALTGNQGAALLHIPYQAGLPINVVASKEGYVCTLLPCRADRMPIFSSVTMPLLALNQGNIWLFDDSVLITSKTSDASLQPTVQFPKSLLDVTDSSNVTSVEAFLTVPKLPSDQDRPLNTVGIVSSKSGYISVELSPVAAVSVQLFSGGEEIHVDGPIRISLSIPDSYGLQPSEVVPAWFFNRTTGGWMRKGLGMVASVEGKLMWTFTAPHLGYWIAAPLSPPRGFFQLPVPIDFIMRHSSFLVVVLEVMLVVVICLLVGSFCYHRSKTKQNLRRVKTKDQSTSMCDQDTTSCGESFIENGNRLHNSTVGSPHNGNVIANLDTAVAITVERDQLDLNTDLNDLGCSHEATQQTKALTSLTDSLFFYNQPMAILHAPGFFHLEENPEVPHRSRSATLPNSGATNGDCTKLQGEDSFTQTLQKRPPADQNQAEPETDDQLEVLGCFRTKTSTNTSPGCHFNLPESVSVPGTLNKMGGLSKIPSFHPPRAWFVSLEGKPAAEIHYAVSEQQRRRRPVESRDTSLDSGVDMSEMNQLNQSGRRAVTLERNATFIKRSSSTKQAHQQ